MRWSAHPQQWVDDLVQETYTKLCEKRCHHLYQFALEHPEAVEAYVRTIAVNAAQDFFKRAQSAKRGAGETVQLLDIVEPKAQQGGLGGPGAIHRELLLQQVYACLDQCTDGPYKARDQLIFWLYYREGMTAKAIAEHPDVQMLGGEEGLLGLSGVESVLHRLSKLVRREMTKNRPQGPVLPEAQSKGLGPANSY
jgi:RNA polymerase sigma-70 factor (ECF subfamily)